MRVAVAAYSAVGFACLDELLGLGVEVGLVLTHRDSPGEKIWFPSVAERGRAAGIPVLTPEDVNAPDVVAALQTAEPDVLFSFYHRQIMRPAVLATPRRGAFNLHGSILPRYRGRSPVNWALVNGESQAGVTLHVMDDRPDHGAILGQRRVRVGRDDCAESLTVKLAAAGRKVLRDVVPALVEGRESRQPQEHLRSSYYGGRKPDDGKIDWTWPAERIRNLVRAVTDPFPGAFSSFSGGRLTVWWAEVAPGTRHARPGRLMIDSAGWPRVKTGEGDLVLTEVSVGSGSIETGRDWARRYSLHDGDRLGDDDATPKWDNPGHREQRPANEGGRV